MILLILLNSGAIFPEEYNALHPIRTKFLGLRTGFPGTRTNFPGHRTDFPGHWTAFPGQKTKFPGSYWTVLAADCEIDRFNSLAALGRLRTEDRASAVDGQLLLDRR